MSNVGRTAHSGRHEKHRVVVTGGAGFIGYHLCKRLLREGHEVVVIDDLSSGSDANIDRLRRNKRFTFLHHDVVEPYDLEADRIFNLACPASPPAYQADPIHTLLTNVLGVRNALDLAVRRGARVLQASTSEVYGDPLVHPQSEDYNGNVTLRGPRACYDEGKRCAETLCHDYRRVRGVDVRVARIFNTYGPAMRRDDGRVVSNFVVQALRGEDLTVYGTGFNTRSICYVDDMVEGLLRLMEAEVAPEGAVNLGNPQERSILDIARLVLRLTASRSRVVHLPDAVDDPRKRRPDIALARRLLGWEPRVDAEAGLRTTIKWFAAELEREERSRIAPFGIEWNQEVMLAG